MRYVEHDPAAARVAALRCRDAAHAYDRIAGVVATETAQVAWWGRERDRVLAEVEVLADDLRGEAAALRATADRLEASARAAERQEAQLRAEAETVAAQCPPILSGPSVGQGARPARASSRSSTVPPQGRSTGVV